MRSFVGQAWVLGDAVTFDFSTVFQTKLPCGRKLCTRRHTHPEEAMGAHLWEHTLYT